MPHGPVIGVDRKSGKRPKRRKWPISSYHCPRSRALSLVDCSYWQYSRRERRRLI